MAQASRLDLTPYEQLMFEANTDDAIKKEIAEEKRVGFYKVKHRLGSGNFSEVKMGTHLLTKDKVAVKILDKFKLDSKTQKLVTREMDIMAKVYHPHTVRFYEQIEMISKMYIVLEYCDCGDLREKVANGGKIAETDARPIYAQIISAIDYLHAVHIVHRDIKAENIYFATPHFIKVGDFGFSTFASREDNLSTFCGSPPYAAPELMKDQTYNGQQVDIWALGVLLYFMVSALLPFRADNLSKLKSVITSGQFNVPEFLSDSCVSLLRGILRTSAKDRMSISQIKKSLWLEDQQFVLSYDEVARPRRLETTSGNEEEEDNQENTRERHDRNYRRRRRRRHQRRSRYRREQRARRDAQVRAIMNEYGITNENIDKNKGNLRNNIIGIYRLLIHRLEKEALESKAEADEGYNTSSHGSMKQRDKNEVTSNRGQALQSPTNSTVNSDQKSAACTVL